MILLSRMTTSTGAASVDPPMRRAAALSVAVLAGAGLLLRQDSAPVVATPTEQLSPATSVALMEIPPPVIPEPSIPEPVPDPTISDPVISDPLISEPVISEPELADPVSEDPSTSPALDPLYFEPESPETDRYLEAVIRRAGVGRDTLDPVALSRLGTLSCHRIESGTTYVSVVGEVARLGGRLPVRAADIVGASTETLCPSPRLALRDTTALR